ncbi:Oidioi.mRNA.OKI2018_I69.XSR.g16405.t1.cds [Oikopleura dioica]|uniref:Oidioi.mRNA.OKI2018_I69.XSR.g16405.t1.cds n=1 Tax=Oikopleura dioica TaxID=34765 RepID=A0ABN7SJY8_OIKDI|nr:Oidioi.mRNA.OKI2018_I69.XSR.g16405.t1.cds [Oikopleura dioica]
MKFKNPGSAHFRLKVRKQSFLRNSKSRKEASRMMLLLNSSEIEELITRLIIEKFDGKNRDLAKESL